MAEAPVEIQYAPGSSGRRSRALRRVVVVMLLAATVFAGWYTWHRAWPAWHKWQRQQRIHTLWNQALLLSAPADQVVYEEDADRGQSLLVASTDMQRLPYIPPGPVGRRPPAVVTSLCTALGVSGPDGPVLFAHERNNPELLHERQLLVIAIRSTRAGIYEAMNAWEFDVGAFLPTWSGEMGCRDWTTRVLVPVGLNASNHRVRFYAGQPDPTDVRHLTIPYEVDGKRGTIDCRLDAHSTPIFSVRDGPATTRPAALQP